MKTEEIWSFIHTGTSFRYLQDAKAGFPIHDNYCIISNIDSFLNDLDRLNLNVTKRASYELEELKKKISKKAKGAKLTQEEATELSKITQDIRRTLSAETKGQFVYRVSDKRLDAVKLIEDVSRLFSPKTFNLCPSIARYDFQEAGKCIAFERPTAAAFHLLRGTEAVLRDFYKVFIRPAKKNPVWGTIINDLRSKSRGKLPDTTLINNLDNLRNSFRNPTQHPEKIYDIEEAQDLFGLCIDVVNRMCRVIK